MLLGPTPLCAANDPNNDPALNSSGSLSEDQAAHMAKPGIQIASEDQLGAASSKEDIAKRAEELSKQ